MKKVVFYSYKGGQGRTMALANLGACLYRLGYRVVMIDLDFEAPGLPHKFNINTFEDETLIGKGILQLLVDSLNYPVDKKLKNPAHNLGDYYKDLSAGQSIPQNGSLILFPTGYTGIDKKAMEMNGGKVYWDLLRSNDFLYLTSEPSQHTQKKVSIFNGIMKVIETELKPDYLLIDARAGINELTSLSMILWADNAICFFSEDAENLTGMTYVIRALQRLPQKRKEMRISNDDVKIFPVISRIPYFLSAADQDGLRKRITEKLNMAEEDKIYLFHTDPNVEVVPHLLIHHQKKIERSQLLIDYIGLLIDVFPEVLEDNKTKEQPLKYLWKRLKIAGVPGEFDDTYRVFRLKSTQGVMINLSDSKRNVSFKVETFCSMLNDIHKGITEKLQTDEAPEQKINNALLIAQKSFYDSGNTCGKRFGLSLVNELWKDQKMTDEEKIAKWCDFDSDVGFGRLKGKDYLQDGDRIEKGTIVVQDNFLATEKKEPGNNLCCLLAGYVAGVLSVILDKEIIVSHSIEKCSMKIYLDDKELENGTEYQLTCEFDFMNSELIEKEKWIKSCGH